MTSKKTPSKETRRGEEGAPCRGRQTIDKKKKMGKQKALEVVECRREGSVRWRDVGRRHSDVIRGALKGYTSPLSPSLHIWKLYEFINAVSMQCKRCQWRWEHCRERVLMQNKSAAPFNMLPYEGDYSE